MRFLKKCLTILLAGMALATSAMAAPEANNQSLIDRSQNGSITITKLVEDDAINELPEDERAAYIQEHPDLLKPLEGTEYRACKIAEIEQYTKENVVSVGYAIDSGVADFFDLDANTATNVNDHHICDVKTLNDALRSKTVEETQDFLNHEANTVSLPLTDAAGKTTISNLPLGLYLLSETPNETSADGNPAFLLSLPSSNPDGWDYDLSIYPKGVLPPPSMITPQTGDNFHPMYVAMVIVLCIAVLAVIVVKKKK